MQKRAPTLGNLLVILLFVLSCFGLLLFMWEAFGGSVPLKSRGYRFTAAFPRTLALAEQSEVKISGVPVGHVISLKLGKDGLTHATMEIEGRYAPLHVDDHVILRQKTLLGETYVQVEPGSRSAPALKNEAELAHANVERFVTLDDILSTFNKKTRHAFRTWMLESAESFDGRGEALNLSLATLKPFVEDSKRLAGALSTQEGAVHQLVRDTGAVFEALTARAGALREFIADGEATFGAAAKASRQWAQAFRELPAFEHRSVAALHSVDRLAEVANPLYRQLEPAELKLTPLLRQAETFAPYFDSFLTSLGPLTHAAKKGLPALSKSLALTTPLLEALRPVLHNLDPFLQYTDEYLPALQSFFANLTAASGAHAGNSNIHERVPKTHYLRGSQLIGPEALAVLPSRLGTNRANPYPHSGAFERLAEGLDVFSASNCADSAPYIEGAPNENVSQTLIEELEKLRVVNSKAAPTPNKVAAPPCKQQGPFSFGGQTSQFPHVSASK